VVRGQVIGYVGHSGRVTGSHVHYEVRIRNTAVNPHKYLRMTLAELGSEAPVVPAASTTTAKAAGLDR
jgi:murein DD-endopeptidase MepM/ murein hydrolase activator NlpD